MELKSLFQSLDGEFEDYRFALRDLYWSAAKRLIRFVVVQHKSKGRIVLMSSKLDLTPETIIRLYAKRWLIETDFKTAFHEVGTFSYHYWMKSMKPTKRKTKQYLHRETEEYRTRVLQKLDSYHRHVAFGCFSQGLMKHLAINHSEEVWASFKGWLRTIRRDLNPSEIVVSEALRSTFWNYFGAKGSEADWVKFMNDRIDTEKVGRAA